MSSNQAAPQPRKKKNTAGWILLLIQTIISGLIAVALKKLNLLPLRYYLVVVLILAILILFGVIMAISVHARVVGIIYSVFLSVALCFGSYYVLKTNSSLRRITGRDTEKVSHIYVISLSDNEYSGYQDLSGRTLGIQEILDKDIQDQTLSKLQAYFDEPLETVPYTSYLSAVNALYAREVDAILYNDAYEALVLDEHPDFKTQVRTLETYQYTIDESSGTADDSQTDSDHSADSIDDITQEPFTVYLSGNDSYGDVSEGGRSDVNILMTVNPKTKQILLTTTPRDSYVTLAGIGSKDKLTHASLYGLDCSMKTLSNLYDIDVDYYVRINFSGFSDVVDALGGVDVYSDYSFSAGGFSYSEGYNHVNGEEALMFVRERHSFTNGDFQRGRNQMHMIQAIIDKLTSPSLLANYGSVMDSLTNCFLTDLSSSEIASLVQMQLNDGASWNIVSNEVDGYSDTRSDCYSMYGSELSVVILDSDSVQAAAEKIYAIERGETVSEP